MFIIKFDGEVIFIIFPHAVTKGDNFKIRMSEYWSISEKISWLMAVLRYNKSVNQSSKPQQTFLTEVFGMQLKVFRTGRTFRIPTNRKSQDQRMLKSIHMHFTYEIFFVTDGMLELITECGTTVYERKAVIIRPHIKHYSAPNGGESFCMLFSVEKPKRICYANALQRILEENSEDSVVCELPMTEPLAFYIHQLSEKCDVRQDVFEGEAEQLISLIFYEVARSLSLKEEKLPLPASQSNRIGEIEKYINNHYSHKFTLSDLANHVFLSPRQVSRIIQKEYGCTFVELVHKKRISVAEMLLRNTDLKVSDIAKQSGMNSEHYFYTLFKRKHGISPLQFRKKYGKKAK